MCEREARRDFEWSEIISRNFLQVLRATRENSRKIRRKENSSKKGALVHQKQKNIRTFDVGRREVQLLDLSGPWHGRQHLEGLLAVNLRAAADAEL